EGIAQASAGRPDLILLDFVMPKMNGYQVCRALNESPLLKDVPVVLMSATGDQVGERFVKVMGIVDYITKPFSPEAITAVVQHTIEKYPRKQPGEAPAVGDVTAPAERAPTPAPPPVEAAPLDEGPALQGNLRTVPLAEVLSLLAAQRQWGVLT